MKNLFIIHFPPPIHGPALIGSFIKESVLINSKFEARYINLGISASVEDIGKGSFSKLCSFFSLVRRVRYTLKAFKPDLCYFTPNSKGPGFYKDALIIALARRYCKNVVYHFHNKGVSLKQHRFLDDILYKHFFSNASVILISPLLYPDIKKYVTENKVKYCTNGIPDLKDKRQKDKAEPETWNLEPGTLNLEPRILFLSHLIESKGVLVLINACRILKDRSFSFHCTISGGNAEFSVKEIENIINTKNLSSFINLTGTINKEEKINLLSSADIFVHPSFNDCLPLVILEAMQFSLPVVSTFEGAIPDAVDDGVTGFLIPQKDAKALADKLEILIKDPDLRHQMGIEGRKKYERKFTLEIFEKRMAEILEEAVSKD